MRNCLLVLLLGAAACERYDRPEDERDGEMPSTPATPPMGGTSPVERAVEHGKARRTPPGEEVTPDVESSDEREGAGNPGSGDVPYDRTDPDAAPPATQPGPPEPER